MSDIYELQNSKRKKNADKILYECGLWDFLSKIGQPHIIGSYRIDLMSDIMVDESFVPTKADKLYMLQSVCSLTDTILPLEGELIHLQVRVTKRLLNELAERYGVLPAVRPVDNERSELSVVVNANAAVSWALKHGNDVEVLQPESLRAQIRDAADQIRQRYQ